MSCEIRLDINARPRFLVYTLPFREIVVTHKIAAAEPTGEGQVGVKVSEALSAKAWGS